MDFILSVIYNLLLLIEYILFFDIILSWLMLFGIRFRPDFIAAIMDPLYKFVQKYIPTRFGMFDFTPLVILLGIYAIRMFILGLA